MEEKWELIDGVPIMLPPPKLLHQLIADNISTPEIGIISRLGELYEATPLDPFPRLQLGLPKRASTMPEPRRGNSRGADGTCGSGWRG